MTDGPPKEPLTLAEMAALARGSGGVECPKCACRDSRVVNTWRLADGTIRRDRRCRNCGEPLPTSTESIT